MVKISAIEKNRRRAKLAKQYANKRARLKAIANDKTLPPEEQFAARLKLAELPRNTSRVRIDKFGKLSNQLHTSYGKLEAHGPAQRELIPGGQGQTAAPVARKVTPLEDAESAATRSYEARYWLIVSRIISEVIKSANTQVEELHRDVMACPWQDRRLFYNAHPLDIAEELTGVTANQRQTREARKLALRLLEEGEKENSKSVGESAKTPQSTDQQIRPAIC